MTAAVVWTEGLKREAVKVIVAAIADAVAATGLSGMPEKTLAVAVRETYGGDRAKFETIMAGLVRAGRVAKVNGIYYALPSSGRVQ
jgi:hypothetical protein